jgi:type IV fimbrial biogenesis protein FimT
MGAFTLIELLVTLAVFAIVLITAVPSFSNMLKNGRQAATTDALVNALNYARNTALDQSLNVIVCPYGSAGSTNCGTNWNNGWMVVTAPTSGLTTLLKSQTLTTTDPTLSSSVASVTFDSHGLITTQSQFKLCDSRGAAFARSIYVLATGFVQSGASPGIAVWNNGALTCP